MIITGQFNDSLPPIMDGVAIAARNYAYWLNKNHAPSFAIGPKVPKYTDEDDFILRYRSLKNPLTEPYRLGVPRVDRSFNKAIESIPFDLIHAHCPFISGNYAYTLARKRNIPLVATFHSKYRDDFASKMALNITVDQAVNLVVRFYEQAYVVWVPNEAIIETLREYGYRGPIEYMPNGSDLEPPEGAQKEKLEEKGRALLGTSGDLPVLLFVGQHRWIKNLKNLIDSLAVARAQGSKFEMRFIGNGPEAEEMEERVTKLGLESCVRFVGPIYDREDLKAIYAAGDLLTFPSLYDNASLVTREAAGFGIPTLFSEGATTAAGIVDGVSGFLSKDSPEEYGAKISAILQSPEILPKVGAGAREVLYKPWEKVAESVYVRYREIVEKYKWEQIDKVRSRETKVRRPLSKKRLKEKNRYGASEIPKRFDAG